MFQITRRTRIFDRKQDVFSFESFADRGAGVRQLRLKEHVSHLSIVTVEATSVHLPFSSVTFFQSVRLTPMKVLADNDHSNNELSDHCVKKESQRPLNRDFDSVTQTRKGTSKGAAGKENATAPSNSQLTETNLEKLTSSQGRRRYVLVFLRPKMRIGEPFQAVQETLRVL